MGSKINEASMEDFWKQDDYVRPQVKFPGEPKKEQPRHHKYIPDKKNIDPSSRHVDPRGFKNLAGAVDAPDEQEQEAGSVFQRMFKQRGEKPEEKPEEKKSETEKKPTKQELSNDRFSFE